MFGGTGSLIKPIEKVRSLHRRGSLQHSGSMIGAGTNMLAKRHKEKIEEQKNQDGGVDFDETGDK